MEVILCIILLGLFLIFAFVCLLLKEYMASAWGGVFSIIMMGLLIWALNSNEEKTKETQEENIEVETIYPAVIYDVTEFQIDTVMNVNGIDTTKTYVITYWK